MYGTIKASLRRGVFLVLSAALASQGCSTLQPPDANGPRANTRPYPLTVSDEAARGEGVIAWKNLVPLYGIDNQLEPQFDLLTGTISALPPNTSTLIRLPKVGAGPTQNEEEIRESLRRFIDDWKELIGAEPSQLSLVERVDEPTGLKLARYEQRPFRYPLRGGFGNLAIRFRNDRQVMAVVSNCIPHSDRVQASLSQLTPKLSADAVVARIKGQSIIIRDAAGNQQTLMLPVDAQVDVRQLVIYAQPAADRNSIDLRLAWEIDIPNQTIKTIYLDAVTDEIIGGG